MMVMMMKDDDDRDETLSESIGNFETTNNSPQDTTRGVKSWMKKSSCGKAQKRGWTLLGGCIKREVHHPALLGEVAYEWAIPK